MKWWTDCCDQLFPGFKTPQLWVARQCRSSTLDLDSNGGRNKCTLQDGKLTDQNRPPICRLLSKSADLAAKKTAKWRLIAQYKNGYCDTVWCGHKLWIKQVRRPQIGTALSTWQEWTINSSMWHGQKLQSRRVSGSWVEIVYWFVILCELASPLW